MNRVPEKFYELLQEWESEVISKVELYIDENYHIYMNPETLSYLSNKSFKLASYHNVHKFIRDKYGTTTIEQNEKTHKASELFQEKLLERLNDSYKNEAGHNIYYDCNQRHISLLSITNPSEPSDKLCDFLNKNTIPTSYGSDLNLYLHAIYKSEPCNNILERIAKRVVHNYLYSIIETINLAIEYCQMEFMLKELYRATRIYTARDFDKHLTLDIPELPYTKEIPELKGVYYILGNHAYYDYEYLFVTDTDYFSVKSFSYNALHTSNTYIQTKTYKQNTTVEVFGTETFLSTSGLQLLEMQLYDVSKLKYTDNFNLDEERFFFAMNNPLFKNHMFSPTPPFKMLMDYYSMHKNAWISTIHEPRTTFRPSTLGIKYSNEKYEPLKYEPVKEVQAKKRRLWLLIAGILTAVIAATTVLIN